MNKFLRIVGIILVIVSNIGCDQVSKHVVREKMTNDRVSVIEPYFTLIKTENTGAFLSLGNSLPQPIKLVVLTILPIALLLFACVYLSVKNTISGSALLGWCCIVGGGAGNLYDRVLYGSVTDFMHIDFGLFQTGIFNMADVSIMVGMAMVLAGKYFSSSSQEQVH